MSTIAVTINGTTRTLSCSAFLAQSQVNAVGSGSLRFTDPDGTVLPAIDQAVVVTVDGSVAWQGTIADPLVELYGELGGYDITLELQDNVARALRSLVNQTFAAGTLKTILQALTASGGALWKQGITLDAGQVTGPTLTAIDATWMTALDFLNYAVGTLAGYVWRIDAANVLKAWAVGSVSSGVTVSRANGNFIAARWRQKRYAYRNAQYVVYGTPGATAFYTQGWTANGSATSWTTTYPASPHGAGYFDDYVYYIFINGAREIVGPYEPGTPATPWPYQWDAATHTLHQRYGDTPLANGTTISLPYRAQYPFEVYVEDPAEITANGLWEAVDTDATISDPTEAAAYAQRLITQSLSRPKMPTIMTTDRVNPGETVVVDLPELALNSATCLATSVDLDLVDSDSGVIPQYTLELVAGSERQETSTDVWRALILGASGGSAMGSGASGGGGSGASPAGSPVSLGGSWDVATLADSYTWVPNLQPFTAGASGTYRVRMFLFALAAGVGVTARLYSLTDGAAVSPASAKITKQQVYDVTNMTTWDVALVAGKTYAAQVLSDTTGALVFGEGSILQIA